MRSNIIELPVRQTAGLRKPEPITRPAEIPAMPVRRQVVALPERRMNPLAVWKRNFVPEQDRMWVHAMKVMQERRAQK